MKTLRAIFLATTALCAVPNDAKALPVVSAFAATLAGGALTGALTGGIVWAAVLGQAAVAGLLAGAQAALGTDRRSGSADAAGITLNRIQPLTDGLICYGERTLGGTIIARSTSPANGKEHGLYHSIIPLACHEIDGAVAIWLGETLVWTEAQYLADAAAGVVPQVWWGQVASDYQYKCAFVVYNGAPDQAAAFGYWSSVPEWTPAHRGAGVAYIYFAAPYDPDLFTNGVPQIRVTIRGKKVYDPRSGVTQYSANAALCTRDYALTPELYGGIGWTVNDIDDASIIALANASDELVQGAARFAYNGVLDTSDPPEANLDRLSTAWSGWWTVDGGLLRLGGGVYDPPAFTITEDIMTAPMRVRARRPFEEQFNVVKAVYADPSVAHTPTDLPVLASNIYRAQDGGETLVRDLGELHGETDFLRGQGLMRLALLKGRRQRMADVTCTLAAWNVRVGDNVMLTVERRGWLNKPFEVVSRSVRIAPDDVSITLSLIETGPDVYNRLTSLELPKPVGSVPSLPSPTARPMASAPVATETLYETRGGGGVKARVSLRADTDNPFVDQYQFSWQRMDIAADEVVLPLTRDGMQTIDDVAPGLYIFGARVMTRRGISSVWAYTGQVEIFGLNQTPAVVSGVTGATLNGMLTLRWNEHPDLDVRQGGKIAVRHSARNDATWQTSTSIGAVLPGAQTLASLPAISGRYLVRAIDATGLMGPVTTFDLTAPDLDNLTLVSEVTEDDTFTGTKTDCSIEGDRLAIDAGQVAATYDFAGSMDFGALKTVRLTTRLAVDISNRSDLFDSDELFDNVALFDGDEDAEGDVQIYYAASDAASGPFGPWVEFDRTDVVAWRLQFRAILTVASDEFKTQITDLGVRADERL